jgi:hypothetical protein
MLRIILFKAQPGISARCLYFLVLLAFLVATMKAMAVLPSELKAAGRLPANQLLRGRILDLQTEANVFRCYLLCGDSYKDMIGIEAWAEVASSAKQTCIAGDTVQCTKVTLVKIPQGKRKFTHSQCAYYIRYDKNTEVEHSDEGTFSESVPVVTLKFAQCLKEGLVNVRACVQGSVEKPPEKQRKDPLMEIQLAQQFPKGPPLQVKLTAWRDFMPEAKNLAVNGVFIIRNLAIHHDKDKIFSLNWVKRTSFEQEISESASQLAEDLKGTAKVSLSQLPRTTKNYSACDTKVVSLSFVSSICAEDMARKFDEQVVWEVPWVSVRQLASIRSEASQWSYVGCETCTKKDCTAHATFLLSIIYVLYLLSYYSI